MGGELVGLGQPKGMLPEVGENQVVVDGCHLVEPGLTEFTLDVVLDSEPEPTVGIHCRVRGGPGGIRGK